MPNPLDLVRKRLRASSRNALELVRLGRLGEAYGAPYEIVAQGANHRLRRYATTEAVDAPPALLIPPLMVTAEVYDVSSDTSAVTMLGALGVQPFVVDFGAPEHESGGMLRTLDDHIRGVLASIDRVRAITGRDVHLCGYSQGGMFAYQAAADRRSAGIRSLVTFGSPVDIHQGLPAPTELTEALVRVVEPATTWLLDRVEGLPGTLTSTIFKMLSPRKELQARVEFVRQLHDRNALVRRDALTALQRREPTWPHGLLHADPAPGAFRHDATTGHCGIIDWSSAHYGPLLYDLASAVMYLGGVRRAAAMTDAYLSAGILTEREVADGLPVMLRFRWAVQADYFAWRITAKDLTGVTGPEENEKGLEDARCALLLGDGTK